MRLFATDTINSKDFEAEAILELPNKKGAPFYFKVFQDFPQKTSVSIQTEGITLYEELSQSTLHHLCDQTVLVNEYAFVPSLPKGHFKASFCGEEASISWTTDQQGVTTITDFTGNQATFCKNTGEIKEILTQEQIELSDTIVRLQEKLKAYVDTHGLNPQDPNFTEMLGILCQLHQHP